MKTTILVTCVAVLLSAAAPAVAASAAPPSAADSLLAAPTHLDHIGRIVVPVWIDGKGPFRFLVDTGADSSMISAALASKLGLVPSQSRYEQVQGTTGAEQLPCVAIESLRTGSIVKHDLRMPISHSPVMTGLDGILGMAGFGAVSVLVDFQGNKVAIGELKYGLPVGYLNIHARRTPGGLLVIPARVGDVQVDAVIDTGAAQTLGNAALRTALLREIAKNPAAARIYGVTKQVSYGGIAASPPIYLGPAAILGLGIVYSDIPIFKIWHLDSRPALIIGMNVLGSVDALVLDYPNSRVYLRPPPPPGVSVRIEDGLSPDDALGDAGSD
jgi:predicted aspartyl protease